MNTLRPNRRLSRFYRHAHTALLVLSLALLGVGIHHKTERAIAPPIYDAMSYYTKGAMVWKDWSVGRLVNPLNVGPTVRPPGTLLVSSPLGFSPDFRAFFFRSIYFPVILSVLGFWLLAESRAKHQAHQWLNLAGASLLASTPMFYQFERNSEFVFTSEWGLVDGFVAGLAGLTMAVLLISARHLSIRLAALGCVLGALTLLVKPVGLLLMAVFCFLWGTELLILHWPLISRIRQNEKLRCYSIWSTILFTGLYGGTTLACFTSGYLSRENLAFAYNGQKIVIDMYKNVSLSKLIASQIPPFLGWHWVLVLLSVITLSLVSVAFRAYTGRGKGEDCRFLAALLMLSGALFWWVQYAGPAQIRYLFPFIIVFIIVTIPDVLNDMTTYVPTPVQPLLIVICAAPLVTVIALLFVEVPSANWQRFIGVNLSAGQFRHEVDMGNLLVEHAQKLGGRLTIYDLGTDQRPAVVEAQALYRNLLEPAIPVLEMRRLNDWVRPIMVRRKDLVESDYLLFYPIRDANRLQTLLATQRVDDPTTEAALFSAWLTSASATDGVQAAAEGTLKLLRVVDHAELDHAFGRFMLEHRWRDLFYAENRDPGSFGPLAFASALEQVPANNRNIEFGNRFVLRGHLLKRADKGLSLELFWHSEADQPLKYFVFVHLIDQSGKILRQADYEQSKGARTVPRMAHTGETWRDTVQLSHDQLRGVTAIAIGIFEPPAVFLRPDRGRRDWDNRRLILLIPQQSEHPAE